jgi:hypothetical protein
MIVSTALSLTRTCKTKTNCTANKHKAGNTTTTTATITATPPPHHQPAAPASGSEYSRRHTLHSID